MGWTPFLVRPRNAGVQTVVVAFHPEPAPRSRLKARLDWRPIRFCPYPAETTRSWRSACITPEKPRPPSEQPQRRRIARRGGNPRLSCSLNWSRLNILLPFPWRRPLRFLFRQVRSIFLFYGQRDRDSKGESLQRVLVAGGVGHSVSETGSWSLG